MSLEESILESEVCKDAVDTQDTLREVFASMCKIHTEYTRFVDELKFSFFNFIFLKLLGTLLTAWRTCHMKHP